MTLTIDKTFASYKLINNLALYNDSGNTYSIAKVGIVVEPKFSHTYERYFYSTVLYLLQMTF